MERGDCNMESLNQLHKRSQTSKTASLLPSDTNLLSLHHDNGVRDDVALESNPPPVLPTEAVQFAVGSKRRLAIIVFIVLSNMVQMVSNMVGLAAGLEISKALGVPVGPGKANWAAASYPLTQGTFVLVSGRLGAVYGHRNVLVVGAVWLVAWSLGNGFCESYVSFNIVRAFSGIGGALIMPNAVALIGTTIPPGRMRNITLGFFGASAPIGGLLGAVWAGIFVQFATWKWIFWGLAIVGACVFGVLAYLLPNDHPVDQGGRIDYVGAALGTGGLVLFNVAWNQAPASGWNAFFEPLLLIVSLALFGAFPIWEHRFAGSSPIMPLDIWTAPSFAALLGAVLLSFMANGIFLWYMVAWLQLLEGRSVLQFSADWTPFAVVATAGTFVAAWLIPRLAAQWILAIGSLSILISNVLLGTKPVFETYWARLFPATVLMGLCPDFVYVAAQIVASNSVSRRHQGVAASLISTLNLYGTSLGLGFAGTVETQVNLHRTDSVLGFRAALFFGAGIALLAMLLVGLFVRVPKDQREGWDDPADAAMAQVG
ncbi:Major facilitator superfamily domain, general substrate transporter [Niveomyces insectorum RCEF 264]|uniref:Major facilitator superfamily domain, general substrate transporter n=1 Tax=Niveomyces insectorum RCEF 264 TaxID=1081102 RepID=A0A167LWB0_9HYPO|nr:Major facilitator superfamily domain, general substrate transporter [Niveomyces insectorum RCEF 264]